MAKTKTLDNLQTLDIKALQKELAQTQATLQKSRVDAAFGRLKDTSKLGKIRKEVARIQTVLRNKEANNA